MSLCFLLIKLLGFAPRSYIAAAPGLLFFFGKCSRAYSNFVFAKQLERLSLLPTSNAAARVPVCFSSARGVTNAITRTCIVTINSNRVDHSANGLVHHSSATTVRCSVTTVQQYSTI